MTNSKVFVYYNLRKKIWSVKALTGPSRGKVIAHLPSVSLKNVSMRVSEAGRQRVLKEGVKNVHAGIVGELTELDTPPAWGARIYYNPKVGPKFVDEKNNVYEKSSRALLSSDKKVFIW